MKVQKILIRFEWSYWKRRRDGRLGGDRGAREGIWREEAEVFDQHAINPRLNAPTVYRKGVERRKEEEREEERERGREGERRARRGGKRREEKLKMAKAGLRDENGAQHQPAVERDGRERRH